MAIDTSTTNTSTTNDVGDFHEQLTAILPRLRIYALVADAQPRLGRRPGPRHRDQGAGRPQELPARHQPGGLAVPHPAQRVHLRPAPPASDRSGRLRRSPNRCRIRPHQESGLVMREFLTAFSKLAPTQREALLLAVVEGLPYEIIAAHTGVSVGTVKSRISRARDRLEHLLIDGEAPAASLRPSIDDAAERRVRRPPASEPRRGRPFLTEGSKVWHSRRTLWGRDQWTRTGPRGVVCLRAKVRHGR